MEPTEALSAAFANVRAVGAEGRGILETCGRYSRDLLQERGVSFLLCLDWYKFQPHDF